MTAMKIEVVGGWDGSAGKFAPLIELHNGGRLALPSEIVAATARAVALLEAATTARAEATAFEGEIGGVGASSAGEHRVPAGERLRASIIEGLATSGPRPDPGEPLRAARLKLAALVEDADLLAGARTIVDRSIRFLFARHAVAIGEQLVELLATTVEGARPDAVAIAGLRWDDPAAVAELDSGRQGAYRRLAAAGAIADLCRQGGLALYLDLAALGSSDRARRADAAVFPIEDLVSPNAGIVGPAAKLRLRGESVGFARSWAWAPKGSAVERLVTAALAVDEPAADLDDVGAEAASA
jgi:hypothetical protein